MSIGTCRGAHADCSWNAKRGLKSCCQEWPQIEFFVWRAIFFRFFRNLFCFSGWVAFRLFGFCGFYVGFCGFCGFSFRILCIHSSSLSHPLHCQFRWLFGFGFWLFASSAFPVGFWPWLPASSASQVPLCTERNLRCPLPPPFRLTYTPN